jgi:putative colanic acid biosynthesis acetyltransferase WcaF
MNRAPYYHASEHIAPETAADPYLRPAFSRRDRLRRLIWNTCWLLLFRLSPRPLFAWRALLLRAFGAKLGSRCRFYPAARVYAPWHLECEDMVGVANGAELYNVAPLRMGSHAIVSQGAYLCGATHDFDDPGFPLVAYAMEIGPYAWVCARACVGPGVNVGEGSVLGLGSVASRNLEPWTVNAGSPAVRIRERRRTRTVLPDGPAAREAVTS